MNEMNRSNHHIDLVKSVSNVAFVYLRLYALFLPFQVNVITEKEMNITLIVDLLLFAHSTAKTTTTHTHSQPTS